MGVQTIDKRVTFTSVRCLRLRRAISSKRGNRWIRTYPGNWKKRSASCWNEFAPPITSLLKTVRPMVFTARPLGGDVWAPSILNLLEMRCGLAISSGCTRCIPGFIATRAVADSYVSLQCMEATDLWNYAKRAARQCGKTCCTGLGTGEQRRAAGTQSPRLGRLR